MKRTRVEGDDLKTVLRSIRRTVACIAAGFVIVFGALVVGYHRIEGVRLHDQTQSCVASWKRTEAIRNMGENVYRTNANTLLELAAGADPVRVAAYKAKVERDVKAIRATLPNPTCDLAAAKKEIR